MYTGAALYQIRATVIRLHSIQRVKTLPSYAKHSTVQFHLL